MAGFRTQTNICRTKSVFPTIGKLPEKLICRNLQNCFRNKLSKLKYRKNKSIKKDFKSMLTDFSEAFDCICHDHAYLF